jgi:hypothetical protein
MISDKILRSKISRFKILSINFKIQPRRLKFNRLPSLNLAARSQFGYALFLNFIGRCKTDVLQNLPRKTDVPQSRLRAAAWFAEILRAKLAS